MKNANCGTIRKNHFYKMGADGKGVHLATPAEARQLAGGRGKCICPGCGRLSFVPYIFDKSGTAVNLETCGRCDHEESCGYHLTPREYIAAHPYEVGPDGRTYAERRAAYGKELHEKDRQIREAARRAQQIESFKRLQKLCGEGVEQEGPQEREKRPKFAPSCLDWEFVPPTEVRAENTPFFRFLCEHFDADTVRRVFRLYHIGADKYGRTIFWQIDAAGRVRTGHVMKYNEAGHRAKNPDGTPAPGAMGWTHAILKNAGKLPEDWQLAQCLFGEHLLRPDDLPAPVCLVEAEKTAVIAACAMPEFTWVATAGKSNLKEEKLRPLAEYAKTAGAVTVFADLGSRKDWADKLEPFKLWLPYTFSDYLEERATEKARARGMDLADYLTGEF